MPANSARACASEVCGASRPTIPSIAAPGFASSLPPMAKPRVRFERHAEFIVRRELQANKTRRGDTDNCGGASVQRHYLPDSAAIAVELVPPDMIRNHDG